MKRFTERPDDDEAYEAADNARFMADDQPDDEIWHCICPHCSGSGEGQNDGSTCSYCKGKGEI